MTGLAFTALGWLMTCALVVRLRTREELVARACHELRSPLTAARLALESGRSPGTVELELRRLGVALDDLAAARRGRRAGDVVEVVAVGDVLDAVRASWTPVAVGLERLLVVEDPDASCFVRADRVRLAQAVGNLVGNALEHGDGAVIVETRTCPGGVRIVVSDAGAGLPAPVETLAAEARAGRGRRGRGLAIALGVAERCGGRLSAAPAAEGARVVLELPAIGALADDAAADRAVAPGQRRLVLVPPPGSPS